VPEPAGTPPAPAGGDGIVRGGGGNFVLDGGGNIVLEPGDIVQGPGIYNVTGVRAWTMTPAQVREFQDHFTALGTAAAQTALTVRDMNDAIRVQQDLQDWYYCNLAGYYNLTGYYPGPQAEAARAERDVTRAEMDAARAKAMNLFRSRLTSEQSASWRDHGFIAVRGNQGRSYQIRHRCQTSFNVIELSRRRRLVAAWCAHPTGRPLPEGDELLAQMLYLAADEDGFRRIANKWQVTPLYLADLVSAYPECHQQCGQDG
jgi:hypothetical protein